MGGLRRIATVAMASLLFMAPQRRAPPSLSDPAEHLVRTRAFLTTTAAALDFTIDTASLANAVFTIRDGSASLRTVIERKTIHLTGNTQGSTADLEIDMILADVVPATVVGWTLTMPT